MSTEVLTVIGAGAIGRSIARRAGRDRRVLIADIDPDAVVGTAADLQSDGLDVSAHHVDVSSRESVVSLAEAAAALGPVTRLVHAATLYPGEALPQRILAVNMVGVALVLEEFGQVVAERAAGVVVADTVAQRSRLGSEETDALMDVPGDELLGLPFFGPQVMSDPTAAYVLSKRVAVLRVQAAAWTWGLRRARVNSISPGRIGGPSGSWPPAPRPAAAPTGTPDDVAAAAAFLLGTQAGHITGADLLVDGGGAAAAAAGRTAEYARPVR